MSTRWYFLSLSLLFSVSHLSRAENGKITGQVTESGGTGIRATIRIEESVRGTFSDSSGWYLLPGIPPGTYDVTASAVGFHPSTVKNVHVRADETATLFFRLMPAEVTMPEVLVVRNKPVIEKAKTSSKTTFDGEEVESLPVGSLTELISTAPGVYGPFIRGAHQYDSRVYVDGVDITDRSASWVAERLVFSNATFLQNTMHVEAAATQSFLSPPMFSVSRASVYAGMSGTEYGTAPGVIAYELREGKGSWHGMLQLRVSQLGGLQHAGPSVYNDAAAYFARRDLLLHRGDSLGRVKAGFFTWSPGKYPYGGTPTYDCDVGIGGSLAEWMGAYFSGAWYDSHGPLPNEWTRKANATAKLSFPFSTTLRLDVLGILQDRGELLGWKNRAYEDWCRFFLEGVPLWDGMSAAGSIKLRYSFSPTESFDFQTSYSHDSNRRGFCDDNNDGIVSPWEDGSYLTWGDSNQVNRYFGGIHSKNFGLFFSTPDDNTADIILDPATYRLNHPLFLYEDYTHRTLNVRSSLTRQIFQQHQLSIGCEIRRHWIDKVHRATQWSGYSGIPFFEEAWARKPMELSGFAEDRMEFAGFTATAGIRFDAFDYDAADIADYFAPRKDATNAAGWAIKVPVRGENVPLKMYVSPRLGISHLITDWAILYYSLARTVSPPPYSCLYYNYSSWLYTEATLRIDQDPMISTTYDVGIQCQMLEGLTGSLGLYYRDMANYSSTAIQPIVQDLLYRVNVWSGSADTRGAELTIDIRPERAGVLNGLRARLSYTYSAFRLGRILYRNQWQYTAAQASALGVPGQLPYGDMQTWDRAYGRDYSGISPMLSGFDRTHQFSLSLTTPLPYGFRLGCIGKFASGFFYPETWGIESNPNRIPSEGYKEGPWNKRVDMRLEKQISLTGVGTVRVFVDVINAFNWTNVLTYYAIDAVTFNAWANSGDPTGGPSVNQPVTMEGSLIYGVPREIYFGVNFTF